MVSIVSSYCCSITLQLTAEKKSCAHISNAFRGLVESMPRQVGAVLAAHESPTFY